MIALYLLGILCSMVIIWRACDGFEAASNYLGRNLSDGVRGATINAIGSSVPELLTASLALLFYVNNEGFAFGVGTTAGSAIFNSAIIPALVIMAVVFAGVVKSVNVSKKVVLRDGLALIVAEFILIWLLADGELGIFHGLTLMGTYVVYVSIMLFTMNGKASEGNDKSEEETVPVEYPGRFKSILKLDLETAVLGRWKMTGLSASILLGAAVIVIGAACDLLVEMCYGLGDAMGVRTYFIAVLLAAAATSVPDTILSIKDARAGEYDDAVANALGSNIFDICVCVGLPLFLYCLFTGQTITVSSGVSGSVAELRVLLLIFTVVIFGIFMIGKGMGLVKAGLMISVYFLFVAYIISRANGATWAMEMGQQFQTALKFLGG